MKKVISLQMKQPRPFALTLVEDNNDTFFPDEQIKEFLYCISKSFTLKHACSMAGIAYATMTDWLNPNNPRHKAGLLKLFERSQAIAFSSHIDAIHNSSDWKAHAFWLERNEKGFAPKDPKNPSIINNIGIASSATERIQLTPEMMRSLSKAYDDMKTEAPPNDRATDQGGLSPTDNRQLGR
jgi:hypothetical protein